MSRASGFIRCRTIAEWQSAYRSGAIDPRSSLLGLLTGLSVDDPAWIALADETQLLAQIDELEIRLKRYAGDLTKLPLYGVPFAVKDNIDSVLFQTTAACSAFAYQPSIDATVVKRLTDAGGILFGKTNLDQFATGLSGTRSPYGTVPNTFNAEYICGGSSSGSASVVSRGLVAFALGTDTAGSGRVPAGFNNVVGLKPTRGWLSTAGVVPACRTLDCVSVFALTVNDAEVVVKIAGGFDVGDIYSRTYPANTPVTIPSKPRFAVPDKLTFFGDTIAETAFDDTLLTMRKLGVKLDFVDYSHFSELADLLYSGPWVAERTVVVEEILNSKRESMNPVVRSVIENGKKYSACDCFRSEYRRMFLAQRINEELSDFDGLLVPTAPTIFTMDKMASDPVRHNSQLGTYTNFVNLADLSALALPAGMRADGLPYGITLIAPAWHDLSLVAFGKRWQEAVNLPLGATDRYLLLEVTKTQPAPNTIRLAVVGAHLTGMPHNFQLHNLGAAFVERTFTASVYRLYALNISTPPLPVLAKDSNGSAIAVELWDIPLARFGEFFQEIQSPLSVGDLQLADGRSVKGFICEPWVLANAKDVTDLGGWREYISSASANVQG